MHTVELDGEMRIQSIFKIKYIHCCQVLLEHLLKSLKFERFVFFYNLQK